MAFKSDEDLTLISLGPAQLTALQTAMLASLARDAEGAALPLASLGFTETDRLYAANGRFHIGRTCNTWVGEMLRATGLKFGRWTPAPYAVRLSLWWFAIMD